MNLICAVDKNWNIGRQNDLLFYIKQDMERFKSLTMGKTVVMGRKTLESLPRSSGLVGRKNIVLTRDENYKKENILVYNDLNDLMNHLKMEKEEVFLIGGGQLISQLISYCHYAYITKVMEEVETADTGIDNLDENQDFQILEESKIFTENGVEFKYVKYINRKRVEMY